MKKIISIILALVLLLGGYLLTELGILEPAPTDPSSSTPHPLQTTAPDASASAQGSTELPTEQSTTESIVPIDEGCWYYSAEDVSLYLYTYGHLPENYITKSEARDLGWDGGSVEDYAEGCAIGGDKFGNREGLLPKASGRQYYECDIDTNGKDSRGAKRIVYSNDGLIYYTDDHYETFTLLYGEE